ncbi:hypothetical protein GJ496_002807 [Pomphorhynchus laevis]|nr:hypothetical protein GJ496_002807 [Pomphorhynchus laevis]
MDDQKSVQRGKKLFILLCEHCHGIENNKKTFGPSLFGLFGRQAASLTNYKYSEEAKAKQFVWNRETLREYLKNPNLLSSRKANMMRPLRNEKHLDSIIAFVNYNFSTHEGEDDTRK